MGAVPFVVGLLVYCVVLLVALALLVRREPSRPETAAEPPGVEPEDLSGHAAAASDAAERAAGGAAYARLRAAGAAAARDAAWHAQELAHHDYLAARAREPASTPPPPPAPDVNLVQSAALSAYRRGELSFEQLQAVWRGVEPMSAYADPVVAEAQSREYAARRAYDAAAARARRAEELARVAEVAADALAEEAAEAAAEVAAEAHEAEPTAEADGAPETPRGEQRARAVVKVIGRRAHRRRHHRHRAR